MKRRLIIKKENTTSEKIPKARKIQTKGMRRAFWGVILFLSVSGVLAFLQTQGLRIKVSSLNKEVSAIQQKSKDTASNSVVLTPEIESFMNRFVALYMAISEDSDTQKLREETLLKEYFAQGIKVENSIFSGKRTLKAASFVSLKKVSSVSTAIYKVTYVIETKGEEDQVKEVSASQLLNIPFQSSKAGSRVISYPYFTALKENKEKARILDYDQNDYDSVDGDTRREVMTYIEEFLEKYVRNSSKDMRYMMDNPEGLQGSASVNQVTGQVFKEKEHFLVKVAVKFKDRGTELLWQENMSFEVVKKSDKYYVQKLDHTW
ncbi:conjugal transfer protein [Enterococcus raffinosus]|uniref:conjugal transfer protein n=1 Tax=Enterococcus raffinosus TaxID=71452 RepID=UPI0028921663|nr:conjugal transfer protein [Enterococcus raffinosus]MDT2555487.1 conjugal transfer protein [Enterococcus raffinosus]